jgi:hypothetical protein
MTVMAKGSYEIYKHQCDLYNLRSWTHGPLKKSPINPLTQSNQTNSQPNVVRFPFGLARSLPSSPNPVCLLPVRPPQPPPCRPPPRARAASLRPRRPPGSPAFSGGAHQVPRVPSCCISTASPPRRPPRIAPGASPPALLPSRLVSSITSNPSTL